MNKCLVQAHHHITGTHHCAHTTNISTKSPLGTQSGDLSQGWLPVLGAIKLDTQKTRDKLKPVVNMNMQI